MKLLTKFSILISSTVLAVPLILSSNFYHPNNATKIDQQNTTRTASQDYVYSTNIYPSSSPSSVGSSYEKISSLLLSKLTPSITSDSGRYFDYGMRVYTSYEDVINNLNYYKIPLDSEEITDLLKFTKLFSEYSNLYTEDRLAAKKELDNLGYYYIKVGCWFEINEKTFNGDWAKCQEDKTFVYFGKSSINSYDYFIKIHTTKTPLNISDLSQYVTITNTNTTTSVDSDINELETVASIKSSLNIINNDIESQNASLVDIYAKYDSLDAQIESSNTQTSNKVNSLLANNPTLSAQCQDIENTYDKKISDVRQRIEDQKVAFKNDKKGSSGFVQVVNKELNYKNDLQEIANLYNEKQTRISVLLSNSSIATAEYESIKSISDGVASTIDKLNSDLKIKIENYNYFIRESNELLTKLNAITNLTYTTTTTNTNKIVVKFNLAKLVSDSQNSEFTSYYNMLDKNRIFEYFYVTSDQFATALNDIVLAQTKINPQIAGNYLIFLGSNGTTVDNNTYKYTYTKTNDVISDLNFEITINETTETINNINTNVVNTQRATTTDASTVLKEINDYKTNITQLQPSLQESLIKINSTYEGLQEKSKKLNEYKNINQIYPNNKTIEEDIANINNEISSYQPETIRYSYINPIYLTLTIVGAFAVFGVPALVVGIIKKKKHNKIAQSNGGGKNAKK